MKQSNTLAPVGHARLAPSAASRWSVCTASVGFIERNRHLLPPDGSVYADEGTKAHALAAEVLSGQRRLLDSEQVDMMHNVRAYVEFVQGLAQPGDTRFIEQRVSLFYLPEQHGTVDVLIRGKKRIAIADLKYGAGVGVYAEENKQLAIYAESAVQELESVDDVPAKFPIELNIFQPRDRNNPEPVRSWTITRAELREFTEPIEVVAKTILSNPDGGEFVPGEAQCKFCPAQGICKAYAAQGLEVISDAPVDRVVTEIATTIPDPTALTREQRVRVIAGADALRKWLDAVEAQEVAELMAGASPLTYKLVEGKTNRKWTDELKAIELLSAKKPIDEIAPRSVISPAQAEKLFKKDTAFMERVTVLFDKPAGKPSLVPLDDKRPALEFNPNADLADIDVI
jgi:hypothetical protein